MLHSHKEYTTPNTQSHYETLIIGFSLVNSYTDTLSSELSGRPYTLSHMYLYLCFSSNAMAISSDMETAIVDEVKISL